MIFSQEELDSSVENVKEKAKKDIAEINQDLTVNSQKAYMREMMKKRLLEQEELKKEKIKIDLHNEKLEKITVSPIIEKDNQLELNFRPEIENEKISSQIVNVDIGNYNLDKIEVTPIIEKEEITKINVIINESPDEFLALEPGPTIDSLVKNEIRIESNKIEVIPIIETESIEIPIIANFETEKTDTINFKKLEYSSNESINRINEKSESTKVLVSIKNDPVNKVDVKPLLEEEIKEKILITPHLDNVVTESFVLYPTLEKDEKLKIELKAKLNNEKIKSHEVEPDLYEEEGLDIFPNAVVTEDKNFTYKIDLKSSDYDHMKSDVITSIRSDFTTIIKNNLTSKKLDVENTLNLVDRVDELPFVGVPPNFTGSILSEGGDGNFADKVAAGAKEVILDVLKEFTADLINESIKEFNSDLFTFDFADVLRNCLENIKERDVFNTLDLEYRISNDDVSGLQDKIKAELKTNFIGESESPLILSWDKFDTLLNEVSDHFYKVYKDGSSINEVVGQSVEKWADILQSMLSRGDYPSKKIIKGRNPAIDALIDAGPDAYKNMYDIILIQVDKTGSLLDSVPDSENLSIDEMFLNILGNSFLAVRSGGITIPEIKSKTADIPYLWTNVTKVVPQVEMSKKQTLSIDADQYLFLYDTFMKLSGKYISSSKYGLIDQSWSNNSTEFSPIQLGSLCSKSWSDSSYNGKLSSKPRLDLLVKLRNTSPFLIDTINIAAGLEPYYVFEDVRFLGNGSLQFNRTDVSRITFDTDFVFRRIYKVTINSHSNTTEKSTLKYIGNRNYINDPKSIVRNDPLKQNSGYSDSDKITNQMGSLTKNSASEYQEVAAKGVSQANSDISNTKDLSSSAKDAGTANLTNNLGSSQKVSTDTTPLNELVTSALERFKESVSPITGDPVEIKFDPKLKTNGNKTTAPSYEFTKQDIAGGNGLSEGAISGLGKSAQDANGSSKPFDSKKAESSVKKSNNSSARVSLKVEEYKVVEGVKVPITSSLKAMEMGE